MKKRRKSVNPTRKQRHLFVSVWKLPTNAMQCRMRILIIYINLFFTVNSWIKAIATIFKEINMLEAIFLSISHGSEGRVGLVQTRVDQFV